MSKISSKNIKRLSVPQSPVVLAILDGWGYRKEKLDNAIKKFDLLDLKFNLFRSNLADLFLLVSISR